MFDIKSSETKNEQFRFPKLAHHLLAKVVHLLAKVFRVFRVSKKRPRNKIKLRDLKLTSSFVVSQNVAWK